MTRLLRTTALLMACVVIAQSSARAEWFGFVEGAILFDDNLSRSEFDSDIEEDGGLEFLADGGRSFEFTDGKRLTLIGSLGYTLYDEFHGMRNTKLGLEIAFRKKFGLGPLAPWLRLSGGAERQEYDENTRDGWVYTGGVEIGRGLGDRWDLSGGVSYSVRRADDEESAGIAGLDTPGPGPMLGLDDIKPADVFDLESIGASITGDLTITEDLFLSLGYEYRDGEVASTALSNDRIVATSSAITADFLFGEDMFAYKIDAVTHVLAVGLGRAVGADSSVNFGYEREIVQGENDIDYEIDVFRASWSVNF